MVVSVGADIARSCGNDLVAADDTSATSYSVSSDALVGASAARLCVGRQANIICDRHVPQVSVVVVGQQRPAFICKHLI